MNNDKPKHDLLFRRAMANPMVAHEFLNNHLPKKLLDILDISTLKLEKESFVEADLKASISDVLFSAKFADIKGYIYVLLEHQSKPDYFMSHRLFKYAMNVYDRHLTLNSKAKFLPLVYPLIIYNGKKKYDAPRNFWDLFSNNELAREFWNNDYQLINVHEIPDEEMKKRVWSGILEFFLKHIHERKLLKRWQEISSLLPQLTKVTVGYDYIKMMLHYTLTFMEQDDRMELQDMLTTSLSKSEGEKIMGNLIQEWLDEGMSKGIKIGEAKGIEIGEARGKAALVKAMLDQNIHIDSISKMTGLSTTEIQKLISLL